MRGIREENHISARISSISTAKSAAKVWYHGPERQGAELLTGVVFCVLVGRIDVHHLCAEVPLIAEQPAARHHPPLPAPATRPTPSARSTPRDIDTGAGEDHGIDQNKN
jgi:hypothetical protein